MTRYYVLFRGKLYPCKSLEDAVRSRDALTGVVRPSNALKDGRRATSPTNPGKPASGRASGGNGRVSPRGANGKTDRKPKKKAKPSAKTPRKLDKVPGQCLYSCCQEPATMTFGEFLNFCQRHTTGAAKVLHKAPTYL